MTAPVTSAVASEEALRNAITATTEQIANRLVDFYQNASGFLHARDQAIQIARIAEQVAPLVEAGQLNVGELVNARLSQTFRVAEPPPVSAAILGRTGVDLPTEYARPLWSAVQASRRGASDVEALAVAARRAKQQVGTDMQMARVKQSREVVRRSRYRHYRRVANPGACPLCRIAATQLYHSEALLPIHGGTCRCGVEPVEDGETQADLDRALDVKSLAAAEDQKKLLGQAVEDGKGAADFRDMIAVREHSETGPTLTWKHQKFQTAEDLGIKSPTLSIDAYERVREGGGVTINLEEGAPSNGFAYAPRKDTEFRVAEADFKPEHIDRYVDSHLEDLAKPGNHLGIWVQDGNVYIDISRVGKPDVSTILEAQAADQLAVYDLGNRREINIGRITNGKYVRIDEAANLYNQYQRQVAGTDQTRSAASVLKVPADQAASRSRERRPAALTGQAWATSDMPPKRIDSHGATSRLQLPGEVEPPSARSTLYPGERWWPKSTVTTGDGRDFERRTGIVTSMHPDLDLGAQKSFLRGIRRMHERFPNVRLEVVEVERHAGGSKPWAFTHFRDPLPIDPDKRVASKIVLDAHTIDSDEHVGMVRAAARSQASAPFEKRGIVSVRTDKGDPYENAAMHEFGHALAKSDRVAVREECKRILREEFLSGVDRLPTQTYNDWMEARFPRYSRSSTDEMLAEAFADVEFNGRKRSDPIFQRIHDMMVDRYNMQANAMGLPEVPIIPGGKSTSIGKTAATPSPIETPTAIVDKAQTRRATRAAAQAEKAAARAAAQAEKAAARAAAQAEKEAAKVAKAAERATARRAKEARQEAAKRTRKATSAFNRQYNRLQTQRAAAAAREAKAAAAEADLRSLAGDIPPAGLSRREIARRVMASTPHVYTDKDAPPGPTTWVDMPSAEERAAALARRIPEMKRNRLQRYSEIPNHTKVAGRRWYPAEGTLGRNTAIDAGLDPIYGTGCGAAFSVRTDIKFNRGYQTQFFAMTAEQRAASANTDFTPTTMTSNLNRAKDVMAAPPTREGILAALQRNSPSPKLSNYFPSLEGDRTAHTADTWDGRVGDHSAIQIREVLGLPPGTRLTDKQEALGEKLLNVEEFGYHWKWIDKKGQWEPVPNYTAANKINDNYGAFKESSVQAAAETPKFPGRYESVFDPATGHYRVVLESTATVPWDPRDLQAALWIHIRNGSGS